MLLEEIKRKYLESEVIHIINRRNRYGMSPLHGASFYGHVQIVELLIDSGADPNL